MAGANVPDAGEEVTCPQCGATVLQKKMVPILAEGATPPRSYVCVTCARSLRVEGAQTSPATTLT